MSDEEKIQGVRDALGVPAGGAFADSMVRHLIDLVGYDEILRDAQEWKRLSERREAKAGH
jgi:hypothetical protein